jgi:hypothetical protein
MIDIVDQLNGAEILNINTCREAAEEITRLRALLEGGEAVGYNRDSDEALGKKLSVYTHPAPVVPTGYVLVPIEPLRKLLKNTGPLTLCDLAHANYWQVVEQAMLSAQKP